MTQPATGTASVSTVAGAATPALRPRPSAGPSRREGQPSQPLEPCDPEGMTTTLDRERTARRNDRPGDGLAHFAFVSDCGHATDSVALCGADLTGQRPAPIGHRQLCKLCECLADENGGWSEP